MMHYYTAAGRGYPLYDRPLEDPDCWAPARNNDDDEQDDGCWGSSAPDTEEKRREHND